MGSAPTRRPIGRPPESVPQDLADSVIAWIESGKTLADWCRIEGHPKRQTIHDWRQKDPVFAGRFARARDLGFDAIAEETLRIADDGKNDTYVDDKGRVRTDNDVIARSKLRVETRLKLLAKWDPKRYGDALKIGGDGGEPLRVLGPREREQRLLSIIEAAKMRREQIADSDGANSDSLEEGADDGG